MPEFRADLAGVSVGDGLPVAVMGVINVSPESFHAGSVRRGHDVLATAQAMVDAGAALIDVGARSTAPYLPTEISEAEETARLVRAVELLAAKLPVPVSADTSRPGSARAALEAGARVINDVSTLRDPAVARLVASHGASLVLMAARPVGAGRRAGPGGVRRPRGRSVGPLTQGLPSGARADVGRETGRRTPPGPARRPAPAPVANVRKILADGLRRALSAGIPRRRIVVDPGIGFFRGEAIPWDEWDVRVLAGLASLRLLGRPVCVGVSRKSFIGAILERPDTWERLAGSLGATAIAVVNGAAVIRTHDVLETRDAVRVAERIRRAGGR
jgi:dihydropteroate synthase